MLAVLFLARLATAVQFQAVPAVGPLIVETYRIDYAALGTLIGLYMLPGIFLGLPGGVLGQRFGDKRIAVAGAILIVIGALGAGLADSYAAALVARITAGSGAVLLNIVLTKMLVDWFAGRELAFAMALFLNSWPVGLGLTLLAVPPLAVATSVFTAQAATAIVGGLALAAVVGLYRAPPGLAPAPAALTFGMSRREWFLILVTGLLWGLYNVGLIIVLAFAPSLLVAGGMDLARASALASIVTWTCVVSAPLGGYLAGRMSGPNLLMAGSLTAFALAAAAFGAGAPAVPTCLALGLFAGLPAGQIMALTNEALRQEHRVLGLGVFFSCYYLLIVALVPVAGLLRDVSGNPGAAMYFAAAMLAAAAAAVGLFRVIQARLA